MKRFMSRMMMRVFFAVIFLVFTWRGMSYSGSKSRNELDGVAMCKLNATAPPAEWVSIIGPRKDIRFQLPPFVAWATSQPEFINEEGGLWEGGGFRVSVSYGQWELSSFDVRQGQKICQTIINKIPVVLIEKRDAERNTLVAWVRSGSRIREPIVEVSIEKSIDFDMAFEIVKTIRKAK